MFPSCVTCTDPSFTLQLMVDADGKQEWKDCAVISGLRLPTGYYFGASSATGDLSGMNFKPSPAGGLTTGNLFQWNTTLSILLKRLGSRHHNDTKRSLQAAMNWLVHVPLDNHDIISMKLYQLTVYRTTEEEEEEEEVTIPSVDNMEQFQGSHLLFSLINTQPQQK